MNKLFIIIPLLYIVLFASCDKALEKELPEHELVGDKAIVDEKSARNALNGAYAYLQFDYQRSTVFTTFFSTDFAVNAALMGGLITNGQRYTFDRSLIVLAVPDSDNILPETYSLLYRMVNAANNVIYYVDRLPAEAFQDKAKAEIIAQAKFLRAFAHMWFMKYYCYHWDVSSPYGPILRREPTNVKNLILPRSTVEEGYQLVLEDLDDCIQNGPVAHTSVYTVSQSVAKAFKAEALMMRGAAGDYAAALLLANEVIASNDFKLEATFKDVFAAQYDYQPKRELMFSRAIQPSVLADIMTYTSGAAMRFSYTVFSLAVGADSYVYKIANSADEGGGGLYESQIMADARYPYTWGEDSLTSGNPPVQKKGRTFRKVWRPNGNCPAYLLRLAQMYLIQSEALARTGAPVNDVIAPINLLRGRSGNALLNAADYPETSGGRALLMTDILREYLMELGLENGSEWFAMIRFRDEAGERMVKNYNTTYFTDRQLALPIPADDIVINRGVVVQNPL